MESTIKNDKKKLNETNFRKWTEIEKWDKFSGMEIVYSITKIILTFEI